MRQLHINNGKKKAYIRNGLDSIKRFPVVGRPLFVQAGEVSFWEG